MRVLLLFVLSLALPLGAAAETVFVTDIVRANLRADPGRSSGVRGVVVTGMTLELLERRDGYARVRTAEGNEGWVKDDFVTTEKPARLQPEAGAAASGEGQAAAGELQGRLDAAIKEKEALGREVATLRSENERLRTADGATAPAPAASAASGDEALKVELLPPGNILFYWIGGFFFIALLGFLFGISWHKNHVSRKLGGLRI